MTDGIANPILTRSLSEVDPYSLSARAFESASRSIFTEAGLGPGTRVLDVCSGSGDLALLLRELVGPEGHVTGIDESRGTAAYASERAEFRNWDNVEFVEAKVEHLPFGRQFDAVVGRMVLMYRRDPVQEVQALTRCLKPGGLVIFQEFDLLTGKTNPPAPVTDQAREWILRAFARAEVELEMGTRLYKTFKAAGLGEPKMRVDGLMGGAESICPAFVTNLVRTLMPQITQLGIASADEIQIDTLGDRMRADLARTDSVMSLPLLVGAWARLPA